MPDTEGPKACCRNCGAAIGQRHDPDHCDTARCEVTGRQLIQCDSHDQIIEIVTGHAPAIPDTPHDCVPDVWSGEWPGVAECREYGWYSRWGPPWIRCEPDHPDATEDLNRLAIEAEWDPVLKRRVKRADLFGWACINCGLNNLKLSGGQSVCTDCGAIQIRRRPAVELATVPSVDLDDLPGTVLRFHEQKNALHREANETMGILAEALGYVHDPEYGWVTGDHSVITLAMEAAGKLRITHDHPPVCCCPTSPHSPAPGNGCPHCPEHTGSLPWNVPTGQ